MKEEIKDALKESTESANSHIPHYNKPLKAKGEEAVVVTKGIETKMTGPSEIDLVVATYSDDTEHTHEALAENIAMKANLGKSCAAQVTEYGARRKTMAEGVTDISDTSRFRTRPTPPTPSRRPYPPAMPRAPCKQSPG